MNGMAKYFFFFFWRTKCNRHPIVASRSHPPYLDSSATFSFSILPGNDTGKGPESAVFFFCWQDLLSNPRNFIFRRTGLSLPGRASVPTRT